MNSKDKQRFSKFLSLILRHKPEEVGLTLMDNGWVNIDKLIDAVNSSAKSDYRINRQLVEEIVAEDIKQRYSISEDGELIRANQGHSIKNLKIEFKEVTDTPLQLYHGTSVDNFEKIKDSGCIKAMSRQMVHLSGDIETATKVGKRHGKLCILYIDTCKLTSSGHKIFISENGVYLVDEVQLDCVIKIEK